MEDEQNYETFLLDFDEAMDKVFGSEKYVLHYAWNLFCQTEDFLSKPRSEEDQSPFVESPDEITESMSELFQSFRSVRGWITNTSSVINEFGIIVKIL